MNWVRKGKNDCRVAFLGRFSVLGMTKNNREYRKGFAFLNFWKLEKRHLELKITIEKPNYNEQYKIKIGMGSLHLLLEECKKHGKIQITPGDRAKFHAIKNPPNLL